MTQRRRPRFVLYGLLGGMLLGFGGGCQYAVAQNARVLERERANNPNYRPCGLIFFAEVGGGMMFAVPGGILGALAGLGCRRLWTVLAGTVAPPGLDEMDGR